MPFSSGMETGGNLALSRSRRGPSNEARGTAWRDPGNLESSPQPHWKRSSASSSRSRFAERARISVRQAGISRLRIRAASRPRCRFRKRLENAIAARAPPLKIGWLFRILLDCPPFWRKAQMVADGRERATAGNGLRGRRGEARRRNLWRFGAQRRASVEGFATMGLPRETLSARGLSADDRDVVAFGNEIQNEGHDFRLGHLARPQVRRFVRAV